MTTYNTRNPIGSKDPRDLYDNAENLDEAVNTRTAESWDDRFGVARKTWHGMEREFNTDQASRGNRFNTFIASSGYQFLGDYAAGIEITEYNQIIRDADGEFWRLSGQVELPYTTTGAGLPEDNALTPLGDAVLRQDLANPDMGAAMVARATVSVLSIKDLLETPVEHLRDGMRFSVASFYEGKNQGGGIFTWSQSIGKPYADGGSVIDPDSTGGFDGTYNTLDDYFQAQGAVEGLGCFVRIGSEDIYPEMFGALADGIADDTGAFNRAAECAYRGRYVLKTRGDNEYLLDGSVSIFTDADLQGTIVKHVKQGFSYIDIKSKQEPTSFKGDGLGGLNEFSTRVTGLPDSAVGKYVHLRSSEILTERSNPPSNTPYTKNSAFFLLNEDGDINVGLDSDYDDPNGIDVYVYDAETPINVVVSKLRVLGAGELNFSIRVQRDNTNIVIGDVEGDEGVGIRTLLSVEANRCQVSSSSLSHTEYVGLGYGISVGLSCDTYIYNVNAAKGRTSIDGRHGHNVTIDRVSVGTCGSHWGNNYRIYNSIVRNITWAGKDLTVRDTTYWSVFLRADVGGLSIGDLVLENVKVKSGSAISMSGSSNDFSLFTKPRRWFDSIKIDGLRFLSDGSEAALWGNGPLANYVNHRVSANRSFHARDVHSSIPLNYSDKLDRAVDIGGIVCFESIHAPTFSLATRGPIDESIDATGRMYTLKDIYGDLILQVDANSHGGITVENSKVVRMSRVNAKPNAGGIITLMNCIYHPTNSSYTENTKALINCILRGNLLGIGGGIDGNLIRQIGCVAEKGAQNYNPNLDYFIDAEYYDGLIEPVEE